MRNDSGRSRAPLSLMTLVIMILLFSLCSAICVQVMVSAYRRSVSDSQRDMAMFAAENAAETLKACGGDMELLRESLGGEGYDKVNVYYDGDWNPASRDSAEYTMSVLPEDSGEEYLGAAGISVGSDEGELFSLRVCWQEVEGNE